MKNFDHNRKNGVRKIKEVAVFFFFISLFAFNIQAQKQVVTGSIKTSNSDALQGISVGVKGTNRGAVSDVNGKYSIEATAKETLIFTLIGYQKKEILVGSRSVIDVILDEDITSLEEVVVVGYGTQRKRDITGAIASITPTALKEVPTANIINSLKGRLAGVDIVSNSTAPGAGAQIRIRGSRQMARSQGEADAVDAPLIVVDGVQFNGSINDLNSDNISSLDVLKDASAKAIYGSRGAGGVILITTKRGRIGKPSFTYSGSYGVVNPIDRYKVFNGVEYAAFKAEAAAGNVVTPGSTGYGLSPAEQAGLAKGISTDWQGLIFKPGYVTEHNLGVSGGTDLTKYGFSAGYYKETGNTPNINYTRYTVQTSIDQKIGKRMSIGLSTMNILGYRNNEGNPIGGLMRLSPLVEPYNADGSVNLLPLTGLLDNATVSPLTIIDNPNAIANKTRNLRTFNTFYADYKILDGLKYTLRLNANYISDNGGNYYGPNTFYNSSTSLAQANARVDNGETSTLNMQHQIDYVKTFNTKHLLTLTGVYEVQKDRRQSSSFSGTGLPADYVQYYNLNLATTVVANGNGSGTGFSEQGLIGFMGRATYSYGDKYALSATFRRDGSSVLSPSVQYYNYPAVSGAWSVSEEEFMKNVPAISNLKLRAGFGVSANGGIAPYTTLGTLGTNFYNFGPGTAGNNIGYIVNSLANKNLTWASTSETNFGLDFGLFKNRIAGSIEVYQQNTKDILLAQNLPASNGATTTTVNAGKTKGNGVEISLSSQNIISEKGFNWSTDINFSLNREQIVELQNPTLKANIADGWFVGQPLTVIYDVKKIGIWQTSETAEAAKYGRVPGQIKIEDINSAANDGKPDGKIDANDRQIIGNFQPQWSGGMTNRFSYKDIDLSVVIHARIGQTVVAPYFMADGGAQGYPFFGNGRVNSLKRDYWTPSNPTNEFPRPDASSDATLFSSTLGYLDGSFIRVRSIDLGYRVPSEIVSKLGIKSLRVFMNITNPFLLYAPFVDKGYGIDPEGNGYGGVSTSQVGGTPVPGRAITVNVNNPTTRQMRFGVNMSF